MTRSEIQCMLTMGVKMQDIKHYRKCCISQSYITSDDTAFPNKFTMALPEEARFFFGVRRFNLQKLHTEINLEVNDELVLDTVNTALFDSRGNKTGAIDEEYIECSRKLTGSDTVIYSMSPRVENSTQEKLMVFICIDERVKPKEGK